MTAFCHNQYFCQSDFIFFYYSKLNQFIDCCYRITIPTNHSNRVLQISTPLFKMEQIPIFKCWIGICDFIPMLLRIQNYCLKIRIFIIIAIKYAPKLISVFGIISIRQFDNSIGIVLFPHLTHLALPPIKGIAPNLPWR